METSQADATGGLSPPSPGWFRAWSCAYWLPGSVALGLAVAWIAMVIQVYFAPLVIFPLLVGVVLGGMMVGLVRLAHLGHRPTIVTGAVLAVLVAVVGQHYFGFRQALAHIDKKALLLRATVPELPKAEQAVPPEEFLDYLQWRACRGRPVGQWVAHDGWAWFSWCVDVLLTAAATLVLVVTSARLPYCNGCRSWYQTIRSGRLDESVAHRLADLLAIAIPAEIRGIHYRLIACQSGCSPAGLSLFWEQTDKDGASGPHWLDPAQQRQVIEVLDRRENQS